MDLYAHKRARVAAMLKRWNAGTVTLTRTTQAAPEDETPWIPGDATTTDVYRLDARADGVAGEYADGTTVLATDRMVIASPKATHTMSDGEEADGAVVDIVPQMTDVLTIDGSEKTIKKIEAVPASGPPAMFHIFVES